MKTYSASRQLVTQGLLIISKHDGGNGQFTMRLLFREFAGEIFKKVQLYDSCISVWEI